MVEDRRETDMLGIELCVQCPMCFKVIVPEKCGKTDRGPVYEYRCEECGVQFKKEVRCARLAECPSRRLPVYRKRHENGEAA